MTDQDNVIRIRPATPADVPEIVRCEWTSTSEGEEVGFGTPVASRLFRDASRLAGAWHPPNHVGSEEVYVAESNGRLVGYTLLEDRDAVLELDTISISGDSQRKGVGTRLLRFVEEKARTEGKSAVTTGTSRNAEGVPWKSFAWWQAQGYRVTGEVVNDWTRRVGEGVREIRMRKDLA
ncbi:MAG: GNAT family N-acetyltransferase [Thermoplasmata archaeon]